MKIIDLTHRIEEEMPVFPGTEKPVLQKANTIEKDGFAEVKITMYSHTGTHMDAPAHMLDQGTTLDQFPIEKFMGKGIILDFSNVNVKHIDVNALKVHEEEIKEVEFLILKTGWSKYWGTEVYYKGFPALNDEAVLWLTQFQLKGIGIDAISIDDMDSITFAVHKKLMEKDILIIENMTNLDAVGEEPFILSVLPLKTKDADGSPIRAVAIKDI